FVVWQICPCQISPCQPASKAGLNQLHKERKWDAETTRGSRSVRCLKQLSREVRETSWTNGRESETKRLLLHKEREPLERCTALGLDETSVNSRGEMANDDAASSTGGDRRRDENCRAPTSTACIEVVRCDQVQRTEIQMSTNSPYYNQYFAYEFHMSKTTASSTSGLPHRSKRHPGGPKGYVKVRHQRYCKGEQAKASTAS
uniref:C2 domain-containing protein n=1 Tax=Macrostomum lignano TaxID=282301 RepID=A0A1I8JPB4_9PLAT